MKTRKWLSAFLLTLMLSVGVVSMPVMAAGETVKQDGLEITLTTDKEEYNDGEEIKLTLKVKNTNSKAVTDLRLASIISDGYQLTEESIQKLKNFVALGAGAEESVDITVVKKGAGTSGGSGGSGGSGVSTPAANVLTSILKSPNTGDSNNIALWVVVFCAGAALIGVAYAIRRKKAKQALSVILCIAMAASTFVTSSETVSAAVQDKTVVLEKTVKYAGKDVTFKANFSYKYEDGYKLVWADEFNGTELDRKNWNVELHDPGWVNSELQAYVDSEDNITVKDGKLIITPIQTKDGNGNYSYTSGRISTQNKQTFKYGKFEARVKVPNGMGYLPAFWLMANDENLYGQWPRCGEIDIMEVWGSATKTAYGTIHYGNPHSESQGTYTLSEGSFADDFHTFTCEWEPGRISWYVDGVLFHTENDWYSATEGQGELAYPAPFDQPFYIILNLAVGGSWVGNPDNATFVSQPYEVDYVRVYQKDSYDENVTKPVKDVVLRDPDANGNYIINGDFSVAESLTDDVAWKFLTDLGGEATAAIKNNEMVINSTNAGTVDYSVQLVQANLPMREGATYTLTFDAYADEARTMLVDVSAPDRSYARYLNDSKVDLTTEKQGYTYTFKMTQSDDANGRLEFNLGNQGSVAGVHISNVKLVQSAYEAPSDKVVKTVLADGNHVYNGQFQEGSDRMKYWTVTNNVGADISVTNLSDGRRLKVVIPESAGAEATVTVAQEDLALTAGAEYAISYAAEGNVVVTVEGVAYANGTAFTANENAGDNHIALIFKGPGTYYIDNVRIDENALIKNGSFSAGFSGYEPFVDSGIASEVTYVVDSITESNAADFTINNTGTQDWHIQLKQNNVKLEKGQWYNLSLKMKSSIARDVSVAIQRDGSKHTNASGGEDWTPYLQKTVALGSDYQTYQFDFQMTEDTDLASIFNVTMGAVGGKQIKQQHRICIDDIALVKIDAPEQEEIVAGTNLIKNADFANGMTDWKIDTYDGGAATSATGDGKITLDITDLGKVSSCVKLNQKDITLEKGATYKMKFAIKSSEARGVKWGLMTDTYNWYDGQDLNLSKDTVLNVDYEFTVSQDTTNTINFYVSMGQMCNVDATYQEDPNSPIETPLSVIEISDISLVKLSDGSDSGEGENGGNEGGDSVTPAGVELIKNGNFANAGESWVAGINGSAVASVDYSNEKATFSIENVGTENWHLQFMQNDLALENGESYKVTLKIKSSAARSVKWSLLDPSNDYHWFGGESLDLEADAVKEVSYDLVANATSNTVQFQITMAPDDGSTNMPAGSHTIEISDVSVMKMSGNSDAGSDDGGTDEGGDSATPAGVELIKNGNFANAGESWVAGINGSAVASVDYSNEKATFSIDNVGTENWHLQFMQNDLALENGETYKVTLKIKSSAARSVKWSLLDPSNDYHWFGGESLDLEADAVKEVSYDLVANATSNTVQFQITMAPDDGSTNMPAGSHTIEISDVSVMKMSGNSDTGSDDSGTNGGSDSAIPSGTELIKNGSFVSGGDAWVAGINGSAVASVDYSNEKATFSIDNVGTENWHLQFMQNDLALENGESYKVTLKIKSSAARSVKWSLLDPSNDYHWFGGESLDLEADAVKEVSYDLVANATSNTVQFQITMAPDDGSTSMPAGAHTIEISDVSVVKQ